MSRRLQRALDLLADRHMTARLALIEDIAAGGSSEGGRTPRRGRRPAAATGDGSEPDGDTRRFPAPTPHRSTRRPPMPTGTFVGADGAAVDRGPHVAAAEAEVVPPSGTLVSILGGFWVSRCGRRVTIPPGRQRQLVKLVAVGGGSARVPAVVDVLWPDVDEEAGRIRLRNVLYRLKRILPVVERDGRDHIVFVDGVEIDAVTFEALVDATMRGGEDAVERARLAAATYRGELLPDDLYDDWTLAPRERLRQQLLKVLDVLAEAAWEAGRLSEALHWYLTAIDVDEIDEHRYFLAASILIAQGRSAKAHELVRRAGGVLEELGIPPSAQLRDLMRAIS